MKKIILLISLVLPLQVAAQVFKTSNQKIVEDAIKSGLVIYRQSYQLQDNSTNQIYGKNGRDEFGKSYSIGIKVEDHLLVPKSALAPWESDQSYQRYTSTHRPLLYKTRARIVCDTLEYECHPLIDSTIILSDNRFIQLKDTTFLMSPGFAIDAHPGKKDGWVVWITSENNIEMSDTIRTENFMIYNKELNISADSVRVKIDNPQTEKKIWGGIYITPKQTQVGTIQFYINGIMQYVGEQWYVYTLSRTTQISTNIEENELTPIIEEQNNEVDASINRPSQKPKKTKKNKHSKTN